MIRKLRGHPLSTALVALFCATGALAATRPFDDAMGVWHLADEKDSARNRHLQVVGAVKLGVALEGAEAEESRRRGGDGKAAVFDGGHLVIGAGDDVLDVRGRAFTLSLRVRDPQGRWNYPLFGSYGDKTQVGCFLRAVDGTTLPMTDRHQKNREVPTVARWLFGTPDGPKAIRGSQSFLEFIWGAAQPDAARLQKLGKIANKDFPLYDDVSHGLMRIGFPAQTMGLTDWHDLVVRFTGPKLQLFVDGVLVDEEFPVGETRRSRAPCLIGAAMENGRITGSFRGLVDHVAVWQRALSDAEIVPLSGGAERVARRDVELLGPLPAQMQYFRPRGYNTKAGDCIPFWHDGTLHLFYLFERRNRHSKWDWGHGALEIHHASTKDLVTWRHHPIAVPVSEQWEAWNGTGALAYHDGQFHFFHPCPSYNKQWPFTGIQLATSRDGEHFTKQMPHPFLEGGDCEIYREEATGLFHMLKGGEAAKGRKALVRLVSRDLREWNKAPGPFMEVDEKYGVRTCPHLFGWNGWFYFMGGNTIWISRQQFGPWTLHAPKRLEQLSVPKTAPFADNRRILAGFLIDGDWGGNIVVRELVQATDGTLGSKFVPEMIPRAGEPIAFTFQKDAGAAPVKLDGNTALLVADGGPASAFVARVPQDARISLEVIPGSGQSIFGVGLRGRATAKESCQLELDPAKRLAQFRIMTDSARRRLPGPRAENVGLPVRPLRLDIICRHDLVDVEIDGRHTLANRYWSPKGGRLYLWVEKGSATFRKLQIQPLIEQP